MIVAKGRGSSSGKRPIPADAAGTPCAYLPREDVLPVWDVCVNPSLQEKG